MYLFISYTLFYVLNTPFLCKQSSIAHFAIVHNDGLFWLNIVTSSQLICDVTRTGGTGIVTSYSSIVIARANWRKGDLHWWITTANFDFSPPGIHGLACKKIHPPQNIYEYVMLMMQCVFCSSPLTRRRHKWRISSLTGISGQFHRR